jgi:hypothetical protein
VLVAESAGTMLISLRSWQKLHTLLLATLTRLFALLAIAGMVGVCIATGAGLIDLWNVLALLNDAPLGMSFLLPLGFIVMVVATVIALIALVRSTLTLRAVSAASVNTSSLPQWDRTGPKDGIIVLPAVVFVCIELGLIDGIHQILVLPPLFLLGSTMVALAVKQQRGKRSPDAHQAI